MKRLLVIILLLPLTSFGQATVSPDSTLASNLRFCITIADSEFEVQLDTIESYLNTQTVDRKKNGQLYIDYYVVKYKILLIRGNYIEYIKAAEDLLEKNQSCRNKTSLFAGLYRSYYEIGAYDQALKYLDFWNQEQDLLAKSIEKGKGKYLLLGEYYFRLGKYQEAIANYKEKLVESDTGNIDGYYLGFLCNNIGLSYYELKMYDSSLVYFSKAENYYIESRKDTPATVLHLKGVIGANKANVYIDQLNYNEAIENLHLTLIGAKKKNISLILQAHVNLAYCNFMIGNQLESEKYLDSVTLRLEDERVSLESKIIFNKRLAEVYENYGDKERAIKCLKDYNKFTDSLQELKDGKYTEFAVLLELRQQEKQIQDQEIELLEKQNIETENDLLKTILWITFVTAIIIVVAITVIVRLQRRVRKELKLKNALAQKDIANKDIMLKEVHHRIKNNLQIVSGFLQIQANSSKNDEVQDTLLEGINRIQTIAELHNVIYQENTGEIIEMDTYLKRIIKLNNKLINKNIQINLQCDSVELPIEKAMAIAMIIEELITNSIKHAFKGKDNCSIDISLKKNEKYVVKYKDSGEGFDSTDINSNSLGLTLIKLFSKRLKATYQNDYQNATYYFEFD